MTSYRAVEKHVKTAAGEEALETGGPIIPMKEYGRPRTGLVVAAAQRDCASKGWTAMFLAVTAGCWTLGSREIMHYFERHGRQGHYSRAGQMPVDATGMGLLTMLVSAAVSFVLGFVALWLAAFFLTMNTYSGSRGRDRSTWGKYSKEV